MGHSHLYEVLILGCCVMPCRTLPGGWPFTPDLGALMRPGTSGAGATSAACKLISQHLTDLGLDADLLAGDEADEEQQELDLQGVSGEGKELCMLQECQHSIA
jgi:hypothetical protein